MKAILAHGKKVVLKDSAAFVVLAGISLCVGLMLNAFYKNPLPLVYQSKWDRMELVTQNLQGMERSGIGIGEVKEISQTEIREYVLGKKGMIVDARPELIYRMGHIQSAVSLPREEFKATYPELREKLQKVEMIVVYCSDYSCEDSELVAAALIKLGHRPVLRYREGYDGWLKAGYDAENSP